MKRVMFEVPGVPVGKGRPKFARRGNLVTAYTPEKTESYENLVKLFASEAMKGSEIFDGPVQVTVALWIAIPASWSGKKKALASNNQIYPTSKPDIDNVIKLIFDACNEIVWKDDKQIVGVEVVKRYSDTPHSAVRVYTV